MIHLRRPAIAAGLACGLVVALVATAAPATAERYTQVDAVRDVVTYSYDLETEEETSAPNPADAASDIRRVRFDFRDDRLVVRATLRASAPKTSSIVQVRAAGDDYLLFSTGSGGLDVVIDDSSKRCRGGSATTRKRTATIRLIVPASCIGDPSSARFGFGVTRSLDRDDRLQHISVDDVGRTGYPEAAVGLKLGKRVIRG